MTGSAGVRLSTSSNVSHTLTYKLTHILLIDSTLGKTVPPPSLLRNFYKTAFFEHSNLCVCGLEVLS